MFDPLYAIGLIRGLAVLGDLRYGLGMPTKVAGAGELTVAVQDYAKAIYVLESRAGVASTTALAERLRVRPGSVSGMLRKLDALGLVVHERYRGVRLTKSGRRVALEVLRHHRLLELYLAESLGMGWDEVDAEADRLEHVISEELEEAIAVRLGHPLVDPHGDPIPSVGLQIEEEETQSLQELVPGQRGTFTRVSDSDPAMLRFLAERGIALGDRFEVVDKQPFDGPVFVRFAGEVEVFGGDLARAMRVTLDAEA
jgi:DtxR family transcriptional regulator, Mn-dependent transcriptional regulator